MAASETWTLDPTSEDAANAQLVFDGISYIVLDGAELPAPELDTVWAGSIDTDGDLPADFRYKQRTGKLPIRIYGTSAANLEANVAALQQKAAKINREGGTFKRVLPSTHEVVYELLTFTFDPGSNWKRFVNNNIFETSLEFTARPGLLGPWETGLSTHNETTLPCLVFTETAIKGDLPAYGRLIITEAQAVDQGWVIWGQQSRYYDVSADAALFYEAEGRTPLGAAALAAGPAGASGAGGNKVVSHTNLGTNYTAVLSTQATGAGNHLKHIGDFQVFARIQVPTGNAGAVTAALEWGEGDFRAFTQNAGAAVDSNFRGSWMLLDLGQVHLHKVVAGTQRWEGRVIAKSTSAGDDIHVDCLFLVPISEGSGRAAGVLSSPTPTSPSAYSDFTTEAGAITGDSLGTGGTWTGAGDATDFNVAAGVATRTKVSDTGTSVSNGRLITASTPTLAACSASVDFTTTTLSNGGFATMCGLILRYVDSSNFLALGVFNPSVIPAGIGQLGIVMRVAGVTTVLGNKTLGPSLGPMTVTAAVTAAGACSVSAAGVTLTAFQSALAAGGALASGKVGLIDWWVSATAATRTYDNFIAYGLPADAAMFASQSLEIRHDRAVREDSSGALWVPPSAYEGDYLRVEPARKEARTNRWIVKGSRNLLGIGPDAGIDDMSAQLQYRPRYLHLPG